MERTSERSERGPKMERTSERSERGPALCGFIANSAAAAAYVPPNEGAGGRATT